MNKGGAFILGAAFGLAAGLFLAPKSGEENLADAKEFARDILGQGQEYYNQGVERVQSRAGASAADKNDQLQAKIEAARKIISEQVAKNAEAAKQAVAAAAAVEVEAAEEAVEAAEEAVEETAEAVEEAVEEAGEALAGAEA